MIDHNVTETAASRAHEHHHEGRTVTDWHTRTQQWLNTTDAVTGQPITIAVPHIAALREMKGGNCAVLLASGNTLEVETTRAAILQALTSGRGEHA